MHLIKWGISVDWLTEYIEQRLYNGLINAIGQLIENTVIKVFTYNTTLISGKKQKVMDEQMDKECCNADIQWKKGVRT